MEAPRPRAGPFIANTMGFLKWMNADTKSLKNHSDNVTTRQKRSGCVRGRRSDFSLPDCIRNAAALFPAVSGQAAHQVRGLQAAAENRPHGAEQQQLTVISSRVTQSSAHFLHDLRRRERLAWLAGTVTQTHIHTAETDSSASGFEH